MMAQDEPPEEPWAQRTLRSIAGLTIPDELIAALRNTDLDETEFVRAACRRLIALAGGVDAMYHAAWEMPRLKGTTSILNALWDARRGRQIDVLLDVSYLDGLNIPLSPEVIEAASRRIADLFAEAILDERRLHSVLWFLVMEANTPDADTSDLVILLSESTISLSLPLIAEYERLIADDNPAEFSYHSFLVEHPVFLEPLAAETIDRHRLGAELITDFIIRNHDNRYVAVEIEKPRDRIFTNAGDFTAQFTHAFGQVVDFIGWLDEHIAYAQGHLPDLESPDGLLVIGRRSDMSPENVAKLRRFSQNSRCIEILTFDDLLNRARHLYESVRHGRHG